MKNQILFVMLFCAAFQMSAQKMKVRDVVNPSIVSWGTVFVSPPTDAKWNNRNGKSFTQAKYAEFTGETSSGMRSSAAVTATISLAVVVSNGTLQVIMEDAEMKPIFDKTFSEDQQFSTDILLSANQSYKIRFIGQNAKGSYFCQWIEKSN